MRKLGHMVDRTRREFSGLDIDTLAQTRDLLLPKPMSGEIRVRDLETTIEAVA